MTMGKDRRRSSLWTWAVLLVMAGPTAMGCSIMQERTNSPMTSVEQLLLSQAVERGLSNLSLPLTPGTPVSVKAFGYTPDKDFAHRQVESWFLAHGYPVVGTKGAAVTVRLLIHALGTEHGESFVGMPSITSVLIPFALPELTLYRAARQRGVARYELELTDAETGALLYRSQLCEGTVFLNQFTVMLWFTFQRTDLMPAPAAQL
ncbi:MAG: hypothetical protein R3B37_12580 [Nitrospira sp.]|nr:DUF3313 domain-containing protein [Nitrospira sp.]